MGPAAAQVIAPRYLADLLVQLVKAMQAVVVAVVQSLIVVVAVAVQVPLAVMEAAIVQQVVELEVLD